MAFGVAGILFGLILGFITAFQMYAPRVRGGPPRAADPLPGVQEELTGDSLMEKIQDRIEHLKQHVIEDPTRIDPLMELGDIYFQAFKFEDAAGYFRMALKATPRDLELRTAVGEYFLRMELTDEARDLFHESVAIDPDHWQSWLDLGLAAFALDHDRKAAEEAFAQVDRIRPGLPQLQEIRKQMAEMEESAGEGA